MKTIGLIGGMSWESTVTYYKIMEALLSNAGFLIYEHMDADEATDAFLKESGMNAPAGVGYCLAVRK
jgi:aspartate/glutamate racemase